jgi:hypothetical protein
MNCDYTAVLPYHEPGLLPRGNPRKPLSKKATANLRKSLKDLPQMLVSRPPILTERPGGKLVILCKHKSVELCIQAGWTTGPAHIWRGLTPEQERRMLLLDNNPPGFSAQWDEDALKRDWPEIDLSEFGLDNLPGIAEVSFDDALLATPAEKQGKGSRESTGMARLIVTVPEDDLLALEVEIEALVMKYSGAQLKRGK